MEICRSSTCTCGCGSKLMVLPWRREFCKGNDAKSFEETQISWKFHCGSNAAMSITCHKIHPCRRQGTSVRRWWLMAAVMVSEVEMLRPREPLSNCSIYLCTTIQPSRRWNSICVFKSSYTGIVGPGYDCDPLSKKRWISNNCLKGTWGRKSSFKQLLLCACGWFLFRTEVLFKVHRLNLKKKGTQA
jgi:hypothetical protein